MDENSMHYSYNFILFSPSDEPHGCNIESFDAGRYTKICSGKSISMTKRDAGSATEHTPANCMDKPKRGEL